MKRTAIDAKTEQRIGLTRVGEYVVSTVWRFSTDHNDGGGVPLIFQTTVYGPQYNQDMQRYSTEEQAMRGHLETIDRLRAGQPPFPYEA